MQIDGQQIICCKAGFCQTGVISQPQIISEPINQDSHLSNFPSEAFEVADFLRRHASEQYFTSSQFLAHDFRQVISLPQTKHSLLGKEALFPLNPEFLELDIPTYTKTNRLININRNRDRP